MKKLALSIGILLLTNFMFAQKINPELTKALNLDAKKTKKITIVIKDIALGKKRPDCVGKGLCVKILIEGNMKEDQCLLISYDKNKLALALKKSLYSKEKLKENFESGEFALDKDIPFSDEIVQKFKAGSELSGKLLLKKGPHKVVETENYFIILQ